MFGFFRRLNLVENSLDGVYRRIRRMAGEFEELRAAVEANGQVAASAVSLIDGLAEKLDAALLAAQEQEDDAPIQLLIDELKGQSGALAEAITKNTPAAPNQQAPTGSPDPNAPAAADPASGPVAQS